MIDWTAYAEEKKNGATAFPLEILVNYSGNSILDIGCGTGKHLAQLDKKKIKVGIEVTNEWFKRKVDSKVKYLSGSAFELPFKSRVFDTVIMIDVIEHLEFPSNVFQEVKRVLSKKGVLVIQSPNYPIKRIYDIINFLKPSGYKKDMKDDPTHIIRLSWSGLERLIENWFVVLHSETRNILMENRFPFLKRIKRTFLGKTIGQKIIIIASKQSTD